MNRSQSLASPIVVLAYRKRHVACYMDYLKRNRGTDYIIAKRVYAICFWLRMIEENPERFPTFDSFDLEHYPKTEFKSNLTGEQAPKQSKPSVSAPNILKRQ